MPIGEAPPPVQNPDPGHPVQFQVLARWESAKPVRLAGGPEVPEFDGQFYVIPLRELPLMPPPKAKPGEVAHNPNEYLLHSIKEGSRLVRKGKPDIPCARLFTGSDAANEVLLFFPRVADPITVADKLVTLESWFAPFHLSVKFPLGDMTYKGELELSARRGAVGDNGSRRIRSLSRSVQRFGRYTAHWIESDVSKGSLRPEP